MNTRRPVALLILLVVGAGVATYCWKQGEPRRNSIQTLRQFDRVLSFGGGAPLLDLILQPTALQGRTLAEQSEFLVKALRDEISVEGLAVLQRDGDYGSLTNIFPAEAKTWSNQAGVNAEDCVALKLERNGLRAEVVLVRIADSNNQIANLRIVRCNNVKQLAASNFNHG